MKINLDFKLATPVKAEIIGVYANKAETQTEIEYSALISTVCNGEYENTLYGVPKKDAKILRDADEIVVTLGLDADAFDVSGYGISVNEEAIDTPVIFEKGEEQLVEILLFPVYLGDGYMENGDFVDAPESVYEDSKLLQEVLRELRDRRKTA